MSEEWTRLGTSNRWACTVCFAFQEEGHTKLCVAGREVPATSAVETYRELRAYALQARSDAILWAKRLKELYPVAADRYLLIADMQLRTFTDAGQRAGDAQP